MRKIFRDIWRSDRRGFLTILALNIAVSFTGGIGIVMLLPMLELLDVSAGSSVLPAAMLALPRGTQVCIMAGVYLLLVCAKALFGRFLSIRQTRFQESYSMQLRERLYSAVTHASYELLNTRRQTDTINLFTSQSGQVSRGVQTLISLLSSTVTSVVQLGIALYMSVPVTLLVLAAGVVFVVGFRSLRSKSRACGEQLINTSRRFYGELHHQLQSIKEIRTYGVEEEHAGIFNRLSKALKDANVRFAQLSATPTMVHSITAAAMIVLVFVVSVLVLEMPTARLMVLVYVFSRLWPVFSGLQGRLQSLQLSIPAYDLLQEAVQAMENDATERAAQPAPMAFEREVRFANVSFSYRNSEEPVLQDVSFTLRKGTITAMTGRSGEGKTTAADLMLGFLRPSEGAILVDDQVLTDANIQSWRRKIGYVPQMPCILNGTVRENLGRYHPGATEDQMIEALKTAQAWSFVSKLPQVLDTVLGDNGVRLSGGERQRLVLARVLMGKPDFILLDEATSALDFESECAIRDVLRSLKGQTTVLIIAHRLATIRIADQAIVLGNRTVDECGSLQELISRTDSYLARMVEVE